MNLPGDPESRPRSKRKLLMMALLVCFGSGLFVSVIFRANERRLLCGGKPIVYWEKQVLNLLPRGGREAEVDIVIKEMGPETTPFWLARMQTKDSPLTRAYSRIWSVLPIRLKLVLPEPIPQRMRRTAAHYVLSKMSFTNGIPELIALSYSNDSELQEYAVHLLWFRAYQFYYPSEECIAAFCHALRSSNPRTRQWSVLGLGILPLHEEALPALEAALSDSDQTVRTKAEETIRQIRAKRPERLKHN